MDLQLLNKVFIIGSPESTRKKVVIIATFMKRPMDTM